jgi:hypothetical protein
MIDNEGLPEVGGPGHPGSSDDGSSSIRFEDLTVDDDLPIIDRVVRYMRSSIALQRLVHVKMLAETSDLAGYVVLRFLCVAVHQSLGWVDLIRFVCRFD